MTGPLEAVLRDCTVLLRDGAGKAVGSGFFVAPEQVLTAAHVVGAAHGRLRAHWNGITADVSGIGWQEPEECSTEGRWGLPDLALLRLPGAAVAGHPCVLLGDGRCGRRLLIEGYTRDLDGGHAPDSVRTELDTVRPVGRWGVLRLASGIVDDGMSGGPVLDLESGQVVGVTKAQRQGPGLGLGGVAVGVDALAEVRPELFAENRRFHHRDRRWDFARLNESGPVDPADCTRRFLGLVKRVVVRRPAILPPGGSRADIHQMPSVKPQPLGQDNAPGDSEPSDSVEPGRRTATPMNGTFQWAPLRVSWPAVVLSGMPGQGKSWLLNMHAEAVAGDALRRVADEPSAWMSVRIPVVLDCAALGRALPVTVTRETVLDAVVRTVRQECAESGADDAAVAESVVRLAYQDGRLLCCLDALDEVAIGDGEKLRRALPVLVEQGNRLIITSRPSVGLRTHTSGLGSHLSAEVVGFSPGQVFAFARSWFSGDPQRAGELEAELLDRPELADLARVPLLAAFLCRLAGETDRVRVLPGNRVEIYRAVVMGALSGRWRTPGQQAVAPHSPPDSELRLRALASAAGRLAGEWRTRMDRLPRSRLSAALREHPEYQRLVVGAECRWEAWQAQRPSGVPTTPPVDAPLWEYTFDALLAHDMNEGGDPVMRFAHPVLAEYCVASYAASLPAPKLREVVDVHRWFDSHWQEVWPLTAGIMAEPDTLVGLFLDGADDAWYEQIMLAARCVAAAGERVDPGLRQRVLAGLTESARSWRSFDRERAVAHLGELVRARLPEAVSAVRELLAGAGEDESSPTQLQAAALLAEAGDPDGLVFARAVLTDQRVPAAYRAWIARAVVVGGDEEGQQALVTAIGAARTPGQLRLLVDAVPVEGRAGTELAERILRDQRVLPAIRATLGGVLIRVGGENRIRAALELAKDPLTVWDVRAQLIADLLAVGEDQALPLGLELFDDPGLSQNSRVALVEALVRRGRLAVLRRAAAMLCNRSFHWDSRRRLASAIAGLGPQGTELLLSGVNSPLPLDLKIRHVIALVEVGECLDLAARLVADTGAPSWARARVASALLRRGYTSLPPPVLEQLATDPDPQHDFQGELIAAMAARGMAGAGDAACGMLSRLCATENYPGDRSFMLGLAGAGEDGRQVLIRIAGDASLAEEDRALAIIALADVAPETAAALAEAPVVPFSSFADARVTILLAEKGVIELAGRLARLLEREPAAYRTLYRLLGSSRVTRELVTQLVPLGAALTGAPPPPSREAIEIDEEYLRGAGLDWLSRTRFQQLIRWVYRILEKRVGLKIAAFLTESQLVEFERLEDEQPSLEFLATRAAGYPELVVGQAADLQDDIRQGKVRPPDPDSLDDAPVLQRLSYTASLLSEWLAAIEQNPNAGLSFLAGNHRVLLTAEAQALLQLAATLTHRCNPHEGMTFVVARGTANGVQEVLELMQDPDRLQQVLAGYLNQGDGTTLLFAALAGILFARPASPVPHFYGALGAAMQGNRDLSIDLMRISGATASPDQRQEGTATLNTIAARFGWDEGTVVALREALLSPRSETADTDTDDEGEGRDGH
ncbi:MULTISPECIES: trypsin-like peptidase domain-containing protein [Streptomyces]|nr:MULTISPECIES: trypsin-like peptidase domain-containing protein [Streptomyces]